MSSTALRSASPGPEALSPAVFIELSSGLTGISIAQLRPDKEPGDFAGTFYQATCANVRPEILQRLSNTFRSAQTITEGAAEVLIDPELAPLGHAIVRLWLTGLWHEPGPAVAPPKVVGGEAYRKSSAWRILQAHPMNDQFFDSAR